MKTTTRIGRLAARAVVASVALMALMALWATPVHAQEEPARPGRVLIVSIPRLTWEQVRDQQPENLTAFLDSAAVGELSLRTIGPRTALGEAYTALGAGNRAGVRDSDAGRVLAPDDPFENGTAEEAFIRRTGVRPDGAALLHLSIAAVRATNAGYSYGGEPGALGTALAGDDITTSVIANADVELGSGGSVSGDPGAPTGEPSDGGANGDEPIGGSPGAPVITVVEPGGGENRPAALALMDESGRIAEGTVSRQLLERDEDAPFGVRLSEEGVLGALDAYWGEGTVGLVELSDLDRADLYRTRADARQASTLAQDSLAHTDRLFGALMDQVSRDDLVVLVSPAAPRSGETLTPIAVRGPGFTSGTLSSGTTRRAGYVTIPDIAPTILEALDIDQPDSMTGATMAATNDGDLSSTRYETFIERNEATDFRDRIVGPITVMMVVVQVILCGLTLVALLRRSTGLRRIIARLALVTMCIPVTTFALGLLPLHERSSWLFAAAMVGGAAVVAVLARQAGAGTGTDHVRAAVRVTLIPIALTYVLLLADVLLGGRLQINTVFGYSPIVAGRFAGFGNPAYALFSMSAVLLACGLWVLLDGSRPGPHRRRLLVGIVALFALTVVVDGHPALGSDVGGVVSIIPTAFVVVWVLLGRRIRPLVVLASGLVSVLALAAFAAVDLQRPESEQTHLGRLVRSTFGEEGAGGLLTVIERKVNANLNILTSSVWTLTIPLALLLLVAFTRRRPALLKPHLNEDPATRATLWGGITMCVTGMAVNDSGIAVPAVMFTLFLPYLIYQAVTPAELGRLTASNDGDGDGDDEGAPPPADAAPLDAAAADDDHPLDAPMGAGAQS